MDGNESSWWQREVATTIISSPLGPIQLAGRSGKLLGVWFGERRHAPDASGWVPDPSIFGNAINQLTEYFAGTRQVFDLALEYQGTAFQRQVWQALKQIPYGSTISYAELARRAGRPGAARAAGAANGRNPLSIVLPCHRVVATTGGLAGYGGGLARKRWLLAHEARVSRHRGPRPPS